MPSQLAQESRIHPGGFSILSMWRWALGVAIVSGLAPATVPVHLLRLVRGKWLCKHDVRLNVSFANGDWAAA